jgi:hypothetical protein
LKWGCGLAHRGSRFLQVASQPNGWEGRPLGRARHRGPARLPPPARPRGCALHHLQGRVAEGRCTRVRQGRAEGGLGVGRCTQSKHLPGLLSPTWPGVLFRPPRAPGARGAQGAARPPATPHNAHLPRALVARAASPPPRALAAATAMGVARIGLPQTLKATQSAGCLFRSATHRFSAPGFSDGNRPSRPERPPTLLHTQARRSGRPSRNNQTAREASWKTDGVPAASRPGSRNPKLNAERPERQVLRNKAAAAGRGLQPRDGPHHCHGAPQVNILVESVEVL